jgi:hypothetical protein
MGAQGSGDIAEAATEHGHVRRVDKASTKAKRDPTSGVEMLAGIIGLVFGAILSYVAQRIHSDRESRRDASIEIVSRWQSSEMLRARTVAYEILRRNLANPNPLGFESLFVQLVHESKMDDWLEISKVVHFFELIGFLRMDKKLDDDILRRGLGSSARFWDEKILSPWFEASQADTDREELNWHAPLRALNNALSVAKNSKHQYPKA